MQGFAETSGKRELIRRLLLRETVKTTEFDRTLQKLS
jgi:hypothetical protein